MATRVLLRKLLSSANQTLINQSFTNSSYLLRFRPIITIAAANLYQSSVTATNVRTFSTYQSTSSNYSNLNWPDLQPNEPIPPLEGCDFEHWLVMVDKPEGEPTRDEIIDSYINTLAQVVGSYDEARMRIYSVSTRCYYAFGALVPEEVSYKLKDLPGVRWVLPDSYLNVEKKDYGGEPFINGKAVPYDPKYHEEWIRNNTRGSRRNDRPRDFDRSRDNERSENMQSNSGPGGAPNTGGGLLSNLFRPGGAPNMGGAPPSNMVGPGGAPNMGGAPPSNMGGPDGPPYMGGPPPSNMEGRPQGGYMGGPPNAQGGPPNNWNGPPPPYGGEQPPNMEGAITLLDNLGDMMPQNMGGGMPNNAPNYLQQGQYAPKSGGMPYQSGPDPNNYPPDVGGGNPYQSQDFLRRDYE